VGGVFLIGSNIFEKVTFSLFIDFFFMVSVLAHINEVMMVVKLMTPLLAWPFALKAFFLLQMHLYIIEEFEGFVNFEEFFMFYISNCLQIIIKLSLALNRDLFCKIRVKDERYDNMYMQHGII
jgi:hypothetical protein